MPSMMRSDVSREAIVKPRQAAGSPAHRTLTPAQARRSRSTSRGIHHSHRSAVACPCGFGARLRRFDGVLGIGGKRVEVLGPVGPPNSPKLPAPAENTSAARPGPWSAEPETDRGDGRRTPPRTRSRPSTARPCRHRARPRPRASRLPCPAAAWQSRAVPPTRAASSRRAGACEIRFPGR